MPMLVEFSVCSDEESNAVESGRMKDGWECVYRTGLDSTGDHWYPTKLLHVWRKVVQCAKEQAQ